MILLRRRILLAAGALAAAPHAFAQGARRNVLLGAIVPGTFEDRERYLAVLRERLAGHGFVEGGNLRIEMRAPTGRGIGSGRETARQLLAMKVDALLACSEPFAEGAHAESVSVPIVFAWLADPVRSGLVASLGRPGGNVTGVSTRASETSLKRFELALELVPGARRVALLGVDHWDHYKADVGPRLAQAAARSGVQLVELLFKAGHQIIDDAHAAGAQIAIVGLDQIMTGYGYTLRARIARAVELRLPVVHVNSQEVVAGGLISYGTDPIDGLRRAADMLARVLKGENPGDLPIDQASRFELALNLKTAKAIGLTVPQSILLRADRVIE